MDKEEPKFKLGDSVSFHHRPEIKYLIEEIRVEDFGQIMVRLKDMAGWFNQDLFKLNA